MRHWAARSLPASEVTRVLGSGALLIHLVQEWGGVASSRHGGALDHRAGGRPRGRPLLLFPPLRLLLLQPLLCHLPPVDGCVAVGLWLLLPLPGAGEGLGWAWADCGVVLACSWWYCGVVMGWLGVV